MSVQLKYDESIAGATIRCNKTGGYVNLAAEYGSTDVIYWTVAGDTYTCTGYYYQSGDITYVQVTGGKYVAINLSSESDKARLQFIANTSVNTEQTVSKKEAQAVVNKIISNDFKITQNNLLCARFAHYLTESQKQDVCRLQQRVEKRNNALSTADFLTEMESAYPTGYGELSPYLEKLMRQYGAISGIGVAISTIIVLVVVAVVAAAISYAVYTKYKEFADEAAKDVQYSDELTRVLTSKLTPEEYQQLLDETNGFVTKHKIAQALSGWKKNIIWIVGGLLAGAAALTMIKNRL